MQIQLVKFNICQSSRPRVSYSTQCTSVLPCDVFQALSFAQTLYCFRSLISGAGIQTSKIIWVCLKMGPLPPIYGNLHRDNMFIHSGMNQSYPIYNWFSSRTYIYFMNLNHPLVSVEIGVPPGNHRNTSPSLLRAPCLWHSRSGWSSFVRQPWCDVPSLSTSFYLCSWGKEDTWHCHAIEVHRLSCFLLRIVVLIVILPVFLLYLFSFFCSIVAI